MKLLVATLVLILQIYSVSVQAADLRGFLKNCAYGTLIGSGVGVATLAFSDKPSDDMNNIARGASLGLYAGIAYGLVKMNQSEVTTYEEPSFAISPILNSNGVDGLQLSTWALQF